MRVRADTPSRQMDLHADVEMSRSAHSSQLGPVERGATMKSLGWPNVVLGVWLIIAPWVLGYVNPIAETQDVVVGMLITVNSLWTLSTTLTSAGALWAQMALAVWLFIGPWVLGYANASPAFTNDLIASALIIIFAIASTVGLRVPAKHPTDVRSRP